LKILFLYADDTYFWRNRLGLASAAKDQGFEVVMMAPIGNYRSEIEKEGVRVIPWNLSRRSMNPLRELRSFLEVIHIYRRERPDIVQHETLKAIMHGGMASHLTGRIPSINVICGLGSIFTRSDLKMGIIRRVVLRILSAIFNSPSAQVVFQNDNNRDLLLKTRTIRAEQAHVTPGTGVGVDRFTPQPEPEGTPIVLLPSRMLWEKGVGEFVAAAKDLREKGVLGRFVLVGAPDPDNPGCISEDQLLSWDRSGIVEWWRHRDDMPTVYSQATLICLPSYYGEGLPNVLAEAGASGRAVVTTDVPGCRQAVSHEVNGLLVPARNSKALSAAIQRLLDDTELRRQLGSMGRERAVREFSHAAIVHSMLGIYRDLLEGKWPTSGRTASERKTGSLTQELIIGS
jgi:glycosyltransferase involved in cell wall biosynthesis